MSGGDQFWDFLPYVLEGIPVTLEVTACALALAMIVSVILALGRSSKFWFLRWPAGFVIETFRGSSSLVQLFWAFYVLPLFGINLPPFAAGVLVLGLNEGSYFSEVVRAGLAAVPAGQRDASTALGFSPTYRFFRIIMPQALPVMIPPFGNAVVTMLKFTSLVSLVTVQDLTFRANVAAVSMGDTTAIFVVIMLIYFVLALIFFGCVKLLEIWVAQISGRIVDLSTRRLPVPDWALGGDR
ncbi:ectoine/hydroxyectoine ABC transporter permease subunit EhuC [Ochrobactrum teleogrylli]